MAIECGACALHWWITKRTDKHSESVTLSLFHGNDGYANAPQYYVTGTLPVLFEALCFETKINRVNTG
jgi:hypothetical protein